MKKHLWHWLLCVLPLNAAFTQTFYFGHDLSYANEMEDCGAVFKENGQGKDIFQIFADRGTNLVRVRMWVDPVWQKNLLQPQGVKPQYSDLADVEKTMTRARAAGMQVLLDLHYSDFWADAGRQVIPARWKNVAYNNTALRDSVYNYTVGLLRTLNAEGLMPDIVKIGNETNGGFLMHAGIDAAFNPTGVVSTSWSRHAMLFNAAIQAVRDVGDTTAIHPKIALHFAGPANLKYLYQTLIDNGVTGFDIMGFSYYYNWHKGSIKNMGNVIRDLKASFPGYAVMALETAYPWTTQNFDSSPNLLTTPDPKYLPLTPEKQLEYLVDYAWEVRRAGGLGVVYWEPDWVSTPCRTPWGQGSAQDNVVFFDPVNTNFMENGGGRWTDPVFYPDSNAYKVSFQVDMTGQDVSKGVFVAGTFTDPPGQPLPMADLGNNLYGAFVYRPSGETGGFYFLNDKTLSARESVPAACAGWMATDRQYNVPGHDTLYAFRWGDCAPLQPPVPDSVNVAFVVDMTGKNVSNGVYVTGDFTGSPWQIVPMTLWYGNLYRYTLRLHPGDEGAYYHLTTNTWTNYLQYRESVPAACVKWYNTDRGYLVPPHDTILAVKWGSCETVNVSTAVQPVPAGPRQLVLFPNPATERLRVQIDPDIEPVLVQIADLNGRIVYSAVPDTGSNPDIGVGSLPDGLYVLQVLTRNGVRCATFCRAEAPR